MFCKVCEVFFKKNVRTDITYKVQSRKDQFTLYRRTGGIPHVFSFNLLCRILKGLRLLDTYAATRKKRKFLKRMLGPGLTYRWNFTDN